MSLKSEILDPIQLIVDRVDSLRTWGEVSDPEATTIAVNLLGIAEGLLRCGVTDRLASALSYNHRMMTATVADRQPV